MSLIDAEYERISDADIDGSDTEAEVRRILDEAPPERILSMTTLSGHLHCLPAPARDTVTRTPTPA
ncbi:MAG: hypothetical protein ACRD2C_08090 [Acidimicrobiales bacterium]